MNSAQQPQFSTTSPKDAVLRPYLITGDCRRRCCARLSDDMPHGGVGAARKTARQEDRPKFGRSRYSQAAPLRVPAGCWAQGAKGDCGLRRCLHRAARFYGLCVCWQPTKTGSSVRTSPPHTFTNQFQVNTDRTRMGWQSGTSLRVGGGGGKCLSLRVWGVHRLYSYPHM